MHLKPVVVPKSNNETLRGQRFGPANSPVSVLKLSKSTAIPPKLSFLHSHPLFFHDDGVLQLFCIDTVAFLFFSGACFTLSFYGAPKTPIRLGTGVIHMSQTLVSCICPTDSFSML